MFKDKVKTQEIIDTELMSYDWTLWRLKLAVRDLKELEAEAPHHKKNRLTGKQVERNKTIQEVRNHFQKYFDRPIDTLCG